MNQRVIEKAKQLKLLIFFRAGVGMQIHRACGVRRGASQRHSHAARGNEKTFIVFTRHLRAIRTDAGTV